MITFKQFIQEANSHIYNTEPLSIELKYRPIENKLTNIITKEPFNFTWNPVIASTSEGIKPIYATRKAIDRVDSDGAKIFYVTGDLAYMSDIKIRPPIFTLAHASDFSIMDYEQCVSQIEHKYAPFYISSMNHRLFEWETHHAYTVILGAFKLYNYYTTLDGTDIENIFKILEYMRDNITDLGLHWGDREDIIYNQLKVKYFPNEATDDDYALNAMYNL